MTGAAPVLVPAAIPATWTTDVSTTADFFYLHYLGPQGQRASLSISVPNPPPPSSASAQRTLGFRGDHSALYQAQDQADPNTHRYLLWNEPGQWAGDPQVANSARPGSVPYYLTSRGINDPEFWSIANSLVPISTNGAVTPNDAVAAFRRLVAGLAAEHANTGVIATANGDIAAVSFNTTSAGGGTELAVQILAFQGGGWTKTATITLGIGGVVQAPATNTTPIIAMNITDSATPDFAVAVSYNDGPAAAIISSVGGTWHALTFTGGPHPGADEIINPTFTPNGVTERYTTCTPTCAAGTYITVEYRYTPGTAQMTAVS
ncbi:MAG TPA: hypothetical protein VNE21_00160 [Mycobacteriales bacterium]|nr:hypothetical protein [Mycobacteriales bacterium]